MRRTEIPRNRRRQALALQLHDWYMERQERDVRPQHILASGGAVGSRQPGRCIVPIRDMSEPARRIDWLLRLMEGLHKDRARALELYAERCMVRDVYEKMNISPAGGYSLWDGAMDILDVMHETL